MTGDQLTIGDALKAEGMARAEQNTDEWWRSCAMQAVEAMAATGRVFQTYDLVTELGLPEPLHPKSQWGALMGAAARAGLVEAVGYGPSARPTTAKSAVRLWRGVA